MALLQNVIMRGTHAARPAASSAGLLYFETDTCQLFRDSGSGWQLYDPSLIFTAKGQLLVASGSGLIGALGAGTDGAVLTADASQTLGVKWATPASGGLTQIAQTTLSATAANITFSSIPGTYSNLTLMLYARGDGTATFRNVQLQFNGDTGSNYDSDNIFGGPSSGSNETDAGTFIVVGNMSAASGPANAADLSEITIPAYAGTTLQKVLRVLFTSKRGTSNSNFALYSAGWWRSTAAITSIVLTPASGNFVAGTQATLYGS